MIDAILTFLAKLLGPGFLIAIVLGIAATAWWDRRPAATPSLDCCIVVHIHAPDSLSAQRDAARQALATERASFAVALATIKRQNASIAGLKTAADHWQAVGVAAESRAKASGSALEGRAARVLNLPKPVDQSALGRCKSAEAVLRGTVQ